MCVYDNDVVFFNAINVMLKSLYKLSRDFKFRINKYQSKSTLIFKIFYNYFNRVSLYCIRGKSVPPKTAIFFVFRNLSNFTFACGCIHLFLCLAYCRKINVPSIMTSQAL